MLKAKVSKNVIDMIYTNLKKYEMVKDKKVDISITRNPINI